MTQSGRKSARTSLTPDRDAPVLESVLQAAVDVGLAGVLFGTPLILGGRFALGRLWLVACCGLAALAWCGLQLVHRRPRLILSGAEVLLTAGGLLIALQLIQLSPQWLHTLSPHLDELLPLWNDAGLGRWQTLSLWPESTRIGAVVYGCYAVFFLILLQRLHGIDDVERTLRWISIATVGLAVLALLQYFAGNGKFLWVFDHPFSDAQDYVKGSFTNRNHFAQCMALGVGPLLWFVLNGLSHGASRPAAKFGDEGRQQFAHQVPAVAGLCALALVVFAGLLSLSRGGALGLMAAGLTATLLLARSRLLDYRFALGIGVFAVSVGTLLSVYGEQAVSSRLGELTTLDSSLLESGGGVGRNRVWEAATLAIQDFPWCGTGLGSHAEVHPLYMVVAHDAEYTHAENGYLQVGVECGWMGLGLVLLGLLCLATWCLLTTRAGVEPRLARCSAAGGACLAASAVHSLADFVWYAPGCMMLTIAAAACVVRARQLSKSNALAPRSEWSLPRPGWLLAGGTVAAGIFWMLSIVMPDVLAEPHFDMYLAIGKDPTLVESGDPQMAKIRELRAAVRANPSHARARLRLARLYLSWFNDLQHDSENPMTVEQLRDAVMASEFSSSEARDNWLALSVGKKLKLLEMSLRQAQSSLRLCPLEGDGYVLRAKLGFLQDLELDPEQDLEQAVRVRPYNGELLFDIGEEAYLKRDEQHALDMWKRSFRVRGPHRQRIIEMLVGSVNIDFIIEEFEPDVQAFEQLAAQCKLLDRQDDLKVVLKLRGAAYEQKAARTDGPDAAPEWLAAYWSYVELDDQALAAGALEHAYASDPNNFDVRYAMGVRHLHREEFGEALPHLQWCQQREPAAPELQQLVQTCRERALTAESPAPREATRR